MGGLQIDAFRLGRLHRVGYDKMSPTGKLLSVFLAHSKPDKPIVREYYELLRLDGFVPWFDERNLIAGQDWECEVRKSIETCHAFVVFLTLESVTRAGYVHRELGAAIDIAEQQPENSIFIIPMRFQGCEVPSRLRHLHWLEVEDAGFAIGSAYRRLQEALILRAIQVGILQGPMPEMSPRPLPYGKEDFLLPEPGTYLIRGANSDKTPYYGTAKLTLAGPRLELKEFVGGRFLTYDGEVDFRSGHLVFSGKHAVSFSPPTRDGAMFGRWADAGVEELIPASPFLERVADAQDEGNASHE